MYDFVWQNVLERIDERCTRKSGKFYGKFTILRNIENVYWAVDKGSNKVESNVQVVHFRCMLTQFF